MDLQDSLYKGYYFDRCIDLEFFDSDNQSLGKLLTPKRSLKPEITVKGELIEGSYAISSYITITNMAYDIDVNAVTRIECCMYYRGIEEAPEWTARGYRGHKISFSVLYADQEKEPPNRAVRFQCTVASFDATAYSTILSLSLSGGNLTATAGKNTVSLEGTGGKTGSIKLIQMLSGIASCYNKMHSGKRKIKYIKVQDKTLADISVQVAPKDYTVGELIRKLNSYSAATLGGIPYCPWTIYVYNDSIYVDTVAPQNWKEMAVSLGFRSDEQLQKFYASHFIEVSGAVYEVSGNDYKAVKNYGVRNSDGTYNTNSVIFLDYVKCAYRAETGINVSTIFDDRIRPGCYCLIMGNAIMGRHRSSGKYGGRILKTTNTAVLFRVTGGIRYEFSTTSGSNMDLTGVMVSEETVTENWNKPTEAAR